MQPSILAAIAFIPIEAGEFAESQHIDLSGNPVRLE
jgi:hypothetical protein